MEDEPFKKDVTVEVDLDKTGISRSCIHTLNLYKLHDSVYEEIPANLKGNVMMLTASRESITLGGIALGSAVIALAAERSTPLCSTTTPSGG
jgi:hypothetical protein